MRKGRAVRGLACWACGLQLFEEVKCFNDVNDVEKGERKPLLKHAGLTCHCAAREAQLVADTVVVGLALLRVSPCRLVLVGLVLAGATPGTRSMRPSAFRAKPSCPDSEPNLMSFSELWPRRFRPSLRSTSLRSRSTVCAYRKGSQRHPDRPLTPMRCPFTSNPLVAGLPDLGPTRNAVARHSITNARGG